MSRPLLLLLLLAGAALLAWTGVQLVGRPAVRDAVGPAASAPHSEPTDSRSGAPAPRDPAPASGRDEPSLAEDEAPELAPTRKPDAAPDVEPTWLLWGHVREAGSGHDVGGLTVALGRHGETVTDAAGRFEIEVETAAGAPGTVGRVTIHDANRHGLLRETCRLSPGMELELLPVLHLRGRVVDATGAGLRAQAVTAQLPSERLRATQRFLGDDGPLGPDGRFEVVAKVFTPPPGLLWIHVHLDGTVFPVLCELGELLGEEGATVIVDLCRLELQVESLAGEGLEHPQVRLASWTDADPTTAVLSYVNLGVDGQARVALPAAATGVELAAIATGLLPAVEWRDGAPCNETWLVQLAPPGEGDVLEGLVLGADGRPVREAWVSCNPPTQELEVSVAALHGVRSDFQGSFSLPCAKGAEARVRAYHDLHGGTPDVIAIGGQRDLVLRFEPAQKITVRLRATGGAALGAARLAEGLDWCLALEDGSAHTGHTRREEFEIEEVPPGVHTLHVIEASGARFARVPVSVFPGVHATAEVELDAAHQVNGVVRRADGAPAPGLLVELAAPDWPVELRRAWGRATTDADGYFELFCGDARRTTLSVSEAGAVHLRLEATPGHALDVRLP